jgi:hypothetical protein
MARLIRLIPAFLALLVGAVLGFLGDHNFALRSLGIAAIMGSVLLVRRAQFAEIKKRHSDAVPYKSDRGTNILISVVLIVSLGAGLALSNALGLSPTSDRLLFLAIGFVGALISGLIGYLRWKQRQKALNPTSNPTS